MRPIHFGSFLVAATAVLTGCATQQSTPNELASFLVLLPLGSQGVRDLRGDFTGNFERELQREGRELQAQKFLHVEGVMSRDPAPGRPERQDVSVLIVPGIFGECVDEQALPFSDGAVRSKDESYVHGYDYLSARLSNVRAVRVHGRASSRLNAELIASEVSREALRPEIRRIVLLAYSKGMPDSLEAIALLQARNELTDKLKALVSVSGVVMGTPVADTYADLYQALAEPLAPMGCPRSFGGEIESLTVSQRTRWMTTNTLPPGVRPYSIVAHTDVESTAPALRPFFKALGKVDGRNDGQVFTSHAVLPGAALLADVRSDHWTYVLPLERNPRKLVRSMSSGDSFPRGAFVVATIETVLQDLDGN